MGVTTRLVEWDDPDAVRLRRAMWEHFRPRYPAETAEAEEKFGGFEGVDARIGATVVATVVAVRDGEAVGGGARRPAQGEPDGVGEVKKVFVDPVHRGLGVARAVMGHLEEAARERGWRRIVLETGTDNDVAISTYLALGFAPIEPYGHFRVDRSSAFLGKDL